MRNPGNREQDVQTREADATARAARHSFPAFLGSSFTSLFRVLSNSLSTQPSAIEVRLKAALQTWRGYRCRTPPLSAETRAASRTVATWTSCVRSRAIA